MTHPYPGWFATLLSLLGILVAPPLAAQENTRANPGRIESAVQNTAVAKPVDVALDSNRQLIGQIVSTGGEPKGNVRVRLMQRGAPIAGTTADGAGTFQFKLDRGGTYQVVTTGHVTPIRIWTEQAAPPGCARQLILVSGETLRGQNGKIPYTQFNPWLVAGVVAAAVAIPVVLANHRTDRGDGS